MKKFVIFLIINIFLILKTLQEAPDDLEINILPSDKYRLSKRDIVNLNRTSNVKQEEKIK